jgi:hypothetical protein
MLNLKVVLNSLRRDSSWKTVPKKKSRIEIGRNFDFFRKKFLHVEFGSHFEFFGLSTFILILLKFYS